MPKSQKSDYAILIGLGLLMALCLLGFYAWGALRAESNRPGARTTHSTNVDGTMVAAILFERIGISLQAAEDPLLAGSLADTGVLWIIDPLIPLNGAEVRAVEEWVSSGGVLVSTGIPGRLFEGPVGDSDLLNRGCVSCRVYVDTPSDRIAPPDSIPESARTLPLAHGVARLQWVSDATLDLMPNADADGTFHPLLQDNVGVRLAERRFGQGSAILLAESSFLANGMIGRQDNAILAVNLARYALSQAKAEHTAYDEYHLGYGHYESGLGALSRMMFTTSPGWAVVSLTLAGLLFLVYKGRRFGTRREPGRTRRRSKVEFVQAVGAGFRSAGAHRLVWRLIYGAWKREATRKLGLPACAAVDEIGARLARRSGRSPAACEGILRDCEQATERARLSARRTADLLDSLARLERETLNGHPGRE